MAKAAADAYEMLQEYLEDVGDQLKAINPLKKREKKINLLTDTDEEEDEEVSYHNNQTILMLFVCRLFLRESQIQLRLLSVLLFILQYEHIS